FAHGSFNITNTLIQLPFIFALAWIVTKIVPGKDFSEEFQPNQLDPLLLKRSPGIALQGAQAEVKNLGNLTLSILDDAQSFSKNGDNKKYKEIKEKINVLDTLQDSIKKYLICPSKYHIGDDEIERQAILLQITRILYNVRIQINDYTASYNKRFKEKIALSDEASEGLQNLYEHVYKSFKK